MRNFYTNIEQLPLDSTAYFSHYHTHWFSNYPKATTTDLDNALSELRLAYKKYKTSHFRIKEMADIVQTGINKFTKKEYKDPPPKNLKEQVIKALF